MEVGTLCLREMLVIFDVPLRGFHCTLVSQMYVSFPHALIPQTKSTVCELTITKKNSIKYSNFRKSNSLFTKFNIVLVHSIFAFLVLWRGNEDEEIEIEIID